MIPSMWPSGPDGNRPLLPHAFGSGVPHRPDAIIALMNTYWSFGPNSWTALPSTMSEPPDAYTNPIVDGAFAGALRHPLTVSDSSTASAVMATCLGAMMGSLDRAPSHWLPRVGHL